ncbi:MAG: CehA/McbA family metallohydrolase [Planctomycetota bacterium]|nr:CehA/McbA family metallohydrolase [Planctomycetota bacterium]
MLALAFVWGANENSDDAVELIRLEESTWTRFVPDGKEVDAIYGDYVLRNKHLTAVIAEPLATRNANMTVRDVGGCLIDLTVRDPSNDQLSAYYPGQRAYPYRSWSAHNADGKPLDLSTQPVQAGDGISVTVHSDGSETQPVVDVIYLLDADAPYLEITTVFENTSSKPLTIPLEDDLRLDGGKEDMVKAPNDTAKIFWAHDRFWDQAYGVDAPGLMLQMNSNARVTSLKFQKEDGETSVTIQPGEKYEFSRRIYPAQNLLGVQSIADALADQPLSDVRLTAVGASGQPLSSARIDIYSGDVLRGSGRTDRNGLLVTRLPVGPYSVKTTQWGQELTTLSIDVKSGENTFDFNLPFHSGLVHGRITDADGKPIPCKVEFVPMGETPLPDFGPESAEFSLKNLVYAPLGSFDRELPAGQYEVVISRGPEYDADTQQIEVSHERAVTIVSKLVRSVDTTGWVSSDFHSHSTPSGDNTGSQLGRVLNLVCTHIEFAPCTEHNRVSTYEPHIRRLGIGQFMATVSGMELTGQPLPLNHQNAFPLEYVPRTQDGGGPVVTDNPETQIERLALWNDRAEKLVQQNHPDLGWLFYDRDGDGTPDAGYERAMTFMDVVEVHPIPAALELKPDIELNGRKLRNRFFNWLQLLNQGYRIMGVVNTDAHYNFHESGGLRNWIKSSTDVVAEIDTMEMVRAAKAGNLIMSNGPFMEVSMKAPGGDQTFIPGDLAAVGGKLYLSIRVQCSNWIDINEVSVLVNGRANPHWTFTRDGNPDMFGAGVVKFDQTIEADFDRDAHVIVVAGGRGLKLGRVMGSFWEPHAPTAVSNPIYIDVDGDGFKPNGDTLDAPLPVREGYPKP